MQITSQRHSFKIGAGWAKGADFTELNNQRTGSVQVKNKSEPEPQTKPGGNLLKIWSSTEMYEDETLLCGTSWTTLLLPSWPTCTTIETKWKLRDARWIAALSFSHAPRIAAHLTRFWLWTFHIKIAIKCCQLCLVDENERKWSLLHEIEQRRVKSCRWSIELHLILSNPFELRTSDVNEMNSQLCLGSRRPLGDWTSRKKNTGNRRFRWTRSDLKTISFFSSSRQQVISVFHATGATVEVQAAIQIILTRRSQILTDNFSSWNKSAGAWLHVDIHRVK